METAPPQNHDRFQGGAAPRLPGVAPTALRRRDLSGGRRRCGAAARIFGSDIAKVKATCPSGISRRTKLFTVRFFRRGPDATVSTKRFEVSEMQKKIIALCLGCLLFSAGMAFAHPPGPHWGPRRGYGGGAVLGAAVLGGVIGGALAASAPPPPPPPVYYYPPPPPPPAYYYPPPPPAYYGW